MLLPAVIAPRVKDGTVTVAYRRWTTNRVKVGSVFLTTVGLIGVVSVDEVDPSTLTAADAVSAGAKSVAALNKSMAAREGSTYRIGLRYVGADPRIALREKAELTVDEVAGITARLSRMDAASSHGSWTLQMLMLIDENPQRRAQDLADILGRVKDEMKIDVRKLKAMGLTQSFDVGYRLSPRGTAYLSAVGVPVRKQRPE